ncbi:DUF4037 domain-containing protein [Candidatus Parcubacteria bacterium]|nr:MAG: DUF4037 domain-containing protein [Candidatus Parcubacteria bacterium]
MPDFIPGLQLSEIFYYEAVKPILDSNFPNLIYSAALIGTGSEVLEFDTPQSMDHHWGLKLNLFVSQADIKKAEKIKEVLSKNLPYEVRGISTNFGKPDKIGVQLLEKIDSGPVNHLVTVDTINSYFEKYLGYTPNTIQILNWLTIPEQKLLEVTSGKVFYDGLNELNSVREKLAYYPQDIWLYLYASQWVRIAQEEAFVGRAGDVGDELGSQVIAARLVREIMKLSFLIEKKYAPYLKWFGTAFSKLAIAQDLSPILKVVLFSKDWKERENNLSKAYKIIANGHNKLAITDEMNTEVSSYHKRPYLTIHGHDFADAIKQKITNEEIKNMKYAIGNVSQFIDSTDILSRPTLTKKLLVLF